MDLNTVTEIVRPHARPQLPNWTAGDAWLAGGTWLFSEPQPHLSRLIDLNDLKWPPLSVDEKGLQIAATCTVAQLDAFGCPVEWAASPLISQCCRAFLASFKIWKTATVGGNICMSLPAGPMISLTTALEGVCTIWKPDGTETKTRMVDFVTGNRSNVLSPGDLLRKIDIPLASLRRRTAFRQISLAPVGRSAVLLIGTLDQTGAMLLTVTASTIRPIQLAFSTTPQAGELRESVMTHIPRPLYHTDIHGKPEWREYMTLRFAEEIRGELQGLTRT